MNQFTIFTLKNRSDLFENAMDETKQAEIIEYKYKELQK